MPHHHFISYSGVDGLEFALKLGDDLQSGPPSFEAWLDKRRLQTGTDDWDKQIEEAIRDCESFIFLMTPDSVEDASVCKNEWVQALKYKKPILLVRFHAKADPPFRLNSRQFIDFTGNFETGLARLRKDLQYLSSPRGVLQAMQYRLNDAQRDLRRASDPTEIGRIKDEIQQLKRQIAEQKRIVENPQAAAQQTERNIQTGLERERQPEKPITGVARLKFINPPPDIAPTYFQDRHVETKLIGDFLKDPSSRLLTIDGRAGIGKTAMVCRLLKALEGGHLPDDLGPLNVNGIVYLSATGSRRINTANLFADLGLLLPESKAQQLDALYQDPKINIEAKLLALLAEFPQGRTVVLLDNLEDLIDTPTQGVKDSELDEALGTILTAPPHAVKVMLTTRVIPRDLLLIQPGRQRQIHLDEGLDSPYAENILREMDADGKVGLKDASPDLLDRARVHTRGYPRALVALYGILAADRFTTLEEVLSKPLPDNVVEALVGEAFDRLDPTSQKVMEALAVYERPITPAAVDYLLQPYEPSVDSAPVLNRLVNMQFVRKEGSRYYQHAADRAYALSRIPKGKESDRMEFPSMNAEDEIKFSPRSAPYTQYALLHRGAEYFKQARQPRETWKKLDDLTPQLNEFELRYAGEDYDTAVSVLLEIDFDYLLLWGHYRLMIGLHERLQGKIKDLNLRRASVGNLGTAHYSMGQYPQAIGCYEEALRIAREKKDHDGEGIFLGSLGICYADLGQTARAIDYYEQALAIAREIGDRGNEGITLGNLGSRFNDLGQSARAIDYHEQALAIAREIGDRRNEGSQLGSLGACYADLGQTARAIEYHEQALAIAHEIGDSRREGIWLGSLGSRYTDLGQTARAIDYYEQALAIAREIGDRGNEGIWIGNLGSRYASIGQTARAIDYHEQALAIAREIGIRYFESAVLNNIGQAMLDQEKLEQAIQFCNQSMLIADEVGNVQFQNESRYVLACARLFQRDLIAAQSIAKEALRYHYPPNNHNVVGLLGVIALRQDSRSTAQQAFQEAIAYTEKILGEKTLLYDALDAKGLALAGLALCGEPGRLSEAAEAYHAARVINKDAGYVKRVLRLLDELAVMDKNGILADVRKAAGG